MNLRASRLLAIDLGAAHVAAGVFTTGATGRLVLQQFALEEFHPDPAHEAGWQNEVARALGSIANRLSLAAPISIAIPGHLSFTKFVKTPSMGAQKREKIVAFEAAENIPFPLEEVVWDYAIVADDGFDLELMLAATKADAMQTLCGSLDAAGFTIERAMPAGLALRHGFRGQGSETAESAVVADIGARTTQLLFCERERFYIRTLPLGGNTITQAVADELQIDFASAESLKVQVLSGQADLTAGSPARSAVERAALSFVAKLQLEITRSSLNHQRQSGATAPVALYVTGGTARLPHLAAVLAEKLKLRVEKFDPLRGIDIAADARAAGADVAAPVLGSLIGLASRLVTPGETQMNLLPPSLSAAATFRRRHPWLMAAVACVVVGLLPPIFYFNRVVASNEAKIAAIDTELMPLHSLQARNEENVRLIEEAKNQIAALRPAYWAKTNWSGFLTDLQGRLAGVEDVWIDQLRMVPRTDETAGASDVENSGNEVRHLPTKFALSGRLLDVVHPQSKVSPDSVKRVKQLLAGFVGSRFVAAVENEHFDNTQPGILRFDFTLVMNPENPL
jgi:type IV pilus assembly protein PilM